MMKRSDIEYGMVERLTPGHDDASENVQDLSWELSDLYDELWTMLNRVGKVKDEKDHSRKSVLWPISTVDELRLTTTEVSKGNSRSDIRTVAIQFTSQPDKPVLNEFPETLLFQDKEASVLYDSGVYWTDFVDVRSGNGNYPLIPHLRKLTQLMRLCISQTQSPTNPHGVKIRSN